jgi:hypothetical protein
MTRVLSELLGASQPAFRDGLHQLERASGHGSTDIRLSADIAQAGKRKLRELGLDVHDTTGRELYAALETRFAKDEQRLLKKLREKYGDVNDIEAIVRELKDVPIPKSCFALKSTSAKKLLKKYPPKKAMKQLGYRSLDSMLKHEAVAHLYAACAVAESVTWHRQLLEAYRKLTAADFEIRDMHVSSPSSQRWQSLAETAVAHKKHNVLSFKELGEVVLLPLPAEQPPAAALTSLLLALHDMNEIRAASTYLKLCQVKPHFGSIVQEVVKNEPQLRTSIFDTPVTWQVIQRYYGRFADRFRAELFEPHIQAEDLTWHSIEKVLAYMDPGLEFWKHTTHLGMLHDHAPVSFNIIDVAINYCNQLPFEQRVMKYYRQSLWHELVIRYLKHDNVEQSVVHGLQSELVMETETVA